MVLKTIVPQGTGGSNPSLSAKKPLRNQGLLFFTGLRDRTSMDKSGAVPDNYQDGGLAPSGS